MEKAKRKEKEFLFRRQEILEEAERMFAAKGFHATTMAEIAQGAGFAIGTLYQFFQGKEDLYVSMVTEKLQLMYQEIRGAVQAREDTLQKVDALVSTYFLFVENNADFCTFFIRSDGATLPDVSNALREQMIEAYLGQIQFIEEIINKGIEDGIFQPGKARDYAFALSGIIRGIIFDWLVGAHQGSLTGKTGLVTDIFLRGVLVDQNNKR
ncbi:MAG: TetR/AcrR family transcriptional regulator [Syntrophales bacterium]|jgi:AcrR family transcriptional regulator|nr:TetR/AcrR family transcriptional regulator [Syntrophales bacterium]MCK9390056.1 TetR/AcrR family transcriptional regulator [Syntrophales bacterium]